MEDRRDELGADARPCAHPPASVADVAADEGPVPDAGSHAAPELATKCVARHTTPLKADTSNSAGREMTNRTARSCLVRWVRERYGIRSGDRSEPARRCASAGETSSGRYALPACRRYRMCVVLPRMTRRIAKRKTAVAACGPPFARPPVDCQGWTDGQIKRRQRCHSTLWIR
jgi:hypothetical protein